MDIDPRASAATQSKTEYSVSSSEAKKHRTRKGLGSHLNGLAATVLAVGILITCAVVYIPFSPTFPTYALDSGWEFGVNAAVAKHIIFGKSLVFTFGPYGSVYTRQYHPATDAVMLCGGALVAIAVTLVTVSLCQGYMRMVALALSFFLLLVPSDAQFFVLPLLALMLAYRLAATNKTDQRRPHPLLVKATWLMAVPTLGMFPLIKGTFGICADIAVFFTCLLLLNRRRFRLAICTAGLYLLSTTLFWIAAGQPIHFLPSFFIAQIPIITGYSDAMSLTGHAAPVVIFIASSVVLWGLGNIHSEVGRDSGLALAIGSAMFLFLGFKEGFVRADHLLIGGSILGIMAFAFVLARQTVLSTFGCVAGLIGFITINHIPVSPYSFIDPVIAQFQTAADAIQLRINDPVLLREQYIAALGAIRAAQPLPHMSGKTDIYSYDQSLLLANGFDWDPRPVLQGYSAYTPKLQAEDAGHLIGPDAPANIIFAVQSIDNRLPMLDDGTSWPILLSAYRFSGFYGRYVLLHRQTDPSVVSMAPLMSGTYMTNAPITLPPNAPFLWARINIRPTLLGKLFGLVFKLPQLYIIYGYKDGHEQQFRYIAGMGQSGFLLAPIVQTASDFATLALPNAAGYFSGSKPFSIRIAPVSGDGLFWHSRFSLTLSAITFPVQPAVTQLLLNPLRAVKAEDKPYPTTTSCAVDEINDNPITHLPVQVRDFLNIAGWAAVSTQEGLSADKVTVTLTNPDGSETKAVATLRPRPDVAAYFKQPSLANSGFSLKTELPHQPSIYTLTIEPSRGGKTWSCSVRIPLQVKGSETGGSDRTVH